ncbi:PQQ-binding-like beta-propeller repeat protein [Halobacterium wangiae]|uniref:outer membrane protein assembly factor BamB family protein n=1 Tax=Halobacterium wangiae TaxID=2902623 RepID=UPI001E6110B8|nr:PQQ-binding-like beta-propeller repeat protein [Halobacterium wangiae]
MERRRLSRRALLAALGSTAAATAGCTAPSRSPRTTSEPSTGSDAADDPEISLSGDDAWTTYGYESGHSGYNPDAAGPDADPTQVWESYVEGIYTLREPAVADGRVYVGSEQSTWAFDATTGEQEWRTDLDSMPHHYPPTYADDTLYVVSKESGGVNNSAPGYVRALNPENGAKRWTTGLPVTSTVAHDGDRLYVAAKESGAGYVRALDAESGDLGWRFDVPDASQSYVTGTPTYADGTLFVAATHVAADGSKSGALYALDPDDGSVNWSWEADSALPVSPVVANDRVHLATRGGAVRAFSVDGEAAWSADTGAGVYTRPTYANGRLFVLTTADIVAYEDAGEELWRAGSERTQMTGMTVAEDTLYVGGEPLFALDATDGSVTFELEVGVFHGSYGAPVVVDDVLYAGICIKEAAGGQYDNYVRAFV